MAFLAPLIIPGLVTSGASAAATIGMSIVQANCDQGNVWPQSQPHYSGLYINHPDPKVVQAYLNNDYQFKKQGPYHNWMGECTNSSVPGFADTSGHY